MVKQKILFFVVLCLLCSAILCRAQQPIKDLKKTVILISLDGFRYDYLDKFQPPTLTKLAQEGVRAKWMIPSFPTKTFPNHYTIATGLYPQNHGIVENNIYDFGTVFSLGKREEVQNSRWWLGEPIWVTAEKQGQRAAAFFFPGTEAEIAGKRPTFWKTFDNSIPNDARIDQILSWLDLPVNERPRFYTLYFSDTDDAGHAHSPDSEEVKEAVERVDRAITRLIEGLAARRIDRKVNLIIVSDHGMAKFYQKDVVLLDEYVDLNDAERILWTGEIVQIFPKPGKLDQIAGRLSKIAHASCWKKSDIPARFHYSQGSRVAPIVCSADIGWVLTNQERLAQAKKNPNFDQPRGAHGYDNQLPEMRALFIGHGRAFKKEKIVEPFPNVDVYNMMCRILGLKPAPNEGSINTAKKVLE